MLHQIKLSYRNFRATRKFEHILDIVRIAWFYYMDEEVAE